MGDWSTRMTSVSRSAFSTRLQVIFSTAVPASIDSSVWGLAVHAAHQRLVHDVVDERGFSRAGDSGDGNKNAEGQVDVDVLQIVRLGSDESDDAPGIDFAART